MNKSSGELGSVLLRRRRRLPKTTGRTRSHASGGEGGVTYLGGKAWSNRCPPLQAPLSYSERSGDRRRRFMKVPKKERERPFAKFGDDGSGESPSDSRNYILSNLLSMDAEKPFASFPRLLANNAPFVKGPLMHAFSLVHFGHYVYHGFAWRQRHSLHRSFNRLPALPLTLSLSPSPLFFRISRPDNYQSPHDGMEFINKTMCSLNRAT